MIKKKDKLMVQDFGIQVGQHWWKRVHEKNHETSMKDIG